MERDIALRLEPGEDFVVTPHIEAICSKALAYLEAGYPIHFSGPAGVGKTTLAMHLASLRNRPVILVYGDEEFGTSDLVGGERGVIAKRVIDNFIHSVLKTEESVRPVWVDRRLAVACKNGYTLVYDEFSRSRPEANNALLSVLEERVLCSPETLTQVHPEFRAIFTSNPQEYAGVHKTQSALLDRMITIKLTHYDKATEIAITQAKSGLPVQEARKLVNFIRTLRGKNSDSRPNIRACIMIAKVVQSRGGQVSARDPIFLEACLDVLGSHSDGIRGKLMRLIEKGMR